MVFHKATIPATPRTVFVCHLLDNDAPTGPCNLNGTVICATTNANQREQCTCSSIAYLLRAACVSCETQPELSWDHFATNTGCGGLPQQFPPPLPAGRASIPGWVLAMISATPTPTLFNAAAASAFASSLLDTSPPTTSSPDPATTTTSPPSTPPPTPSPPVNLPQTDTNVAGAGVSGPSPSSIPKSTIPSTSTHLIGTSSSRQSTTGSQNPTLGVTPSLVSSNSMGEQPTMASNESAALIHRNILSTGSIVGIVLAICTLISLVALVLWYRRRRWQQGRANSTLMVEAFPIASTSSPSSTAAAGNYSDVQSISAVRRSFLQNELRAAQEKMLLHSDSEPSTPTQSQSAAFPDPIFRGIFSSRASTNTNTPDLFSRLQQRDNMLTARIRELEEQLESPWARGLSDEPPPSYSGEES